MINSSPPTLSGRAPSPMKARIEREGAEDPGHEVGGIELGQQAGRPEAEQQERDVGSESSRMNDRNGLIGTSVGVAPARSRTRVSPADLDRAAVGEGQDLLDGGSHAVDGADGDRLARRRRLRITDGGDGPVDVAVTGLRDGGDLGDGVVLDLVAERARDVLALAADRRCRPDVRPGAMTAMLAASVMNVPALAARAAGRGDPHDRRDLCLQERPRRCRWSRSGSRPACSA